MAPRDPWKIEVHWRFENFPLGEPGTSLLQDMLSLGSIETMGNLARQEED